MLTIAHQDGSIEGAALAAGTPVEDDNAAAALAAGLAANHQVIAARSFYHRRDDGQCVKIGERQIIEERGCALDALAVGAARLDPPLPEGVMFSAPRSKETLAPVESSAPVDNPPPPRRRMFRKAGEFGADQSED